LTAHRLDVEAALVEGEWVQGDVIVDGPTIREVGVSPAGGGGRAVPGFVDLQVNGFAGVSFTTCDSLGFGRACAALAARGTTSFLPTIPTAAPDRYPQAMAVAGEAIAHPGPGSRPLGVHLEGPFLSPLRHGAHDPRYLLEPDPSRLAQLCDFGPVALVTLAPELPGADRLVDLLRERGIVVSAGHSDATGADAHSAFARGVTMVTHLWNAQRQITSREPGLAGAALARPDVWVGVIADLVHVSRETLTISVAAAGPRVVAVSDAAAVAGLPDGLHEANGHAVTVADGAV
jgi:N-acetylglucosamine-6-phosphate deacetylase